ncbi:hypothetical protein EBZ80_01115 [bacterium]|nr:hypothetical protein [bacterium]
MISPTPSYTLISTISPKALMPLIPAYPTITPVPVSATPQKRIGIIIAIIITVVILLSLISIGIAFYVR